MVSRSLATCLALSSLSNSFIIKWGISQGGWGAFCHCDSPAGREISMWQLKVCVEAETRDEILRVDDK